MYKFDRAWTLRCGFLSYRLLKDTRESDSTHRVERPVITRFPTRVEQKVVFNDGPASKPIVLVDRSAWHVVEQIPRDV